MTVKCTGDMYSTCIFCNSSLGRNEVFELFPVGRRIAFDSARGRLWVVCGTCERWNLSPLEERWEAVEWCEEQFSGTRLRVSTENIGLARLREGLELVRIGRPLRPEFAAWRYGDQFGRRRRRALLTAGAGLGVVGAGAALGVTAGFTIFMGGALARSVRTIVRGRPNAIVARIRAEDGRLIRIARKQLERVRLVEADANEWQLIVPDGSDVISLTGDAAYRASGALLPAVNRYGGSKSVVQDAVTRIEEQGSPAKFLSMLARTSGFREAKPITEFTQPTRLALEMAVHEDVERRALEDELTALESAWRDAAQIAAIADDLLLPRSMLNAIDRLRGRTTTR